MSKTVVLIHGACAGGWCFDGFIRELQQRGWTCHAPNLRYHGGPNAKPDAKLSETSLADYTHDMGYFIERLGTQPLVIGHSMGGLIAQQLAEKGLARGLVLLSSCAPWGVLPATNAERELARNLMTVGPLWTQTLQPALEAAKQDSLASLDDAAQRAVFEKLGPESGRALFELFFWMFDDMRASAVEAARVRCPVLVVAGSDDKVVSAATGRKIAQLYGRLGMFHEVRGRGHMLPVEPGAAELAGMCADWMADVLGELPGLESVKAGRL
jgi:pimeloyl-ACP methyl ester carboxylesterase